MTEYRREQAWQAGHKARLANKPQTACNRQHGTIFYDDWHDGWMHADNELARQNPSEQPA